MVIACLTNAFWANLCRALGLQAYINDTRFDTLEKRKANREAVDTMISAETEKHHFDELAALLTANNVPHAPILGILDALKQPQAVAREMVVETDHAALGKIPIVNRPIKWPGETQPVPEAPPVLGQHTDAILSDLLGLSSAEVAALRKANIVA